MTPGSRTNSEGGAGEGSGDDALIVPGPTSPGPYIGKDYVHRGVGLILDPEQAWPKLHKTARRSVRRAKEAGHVTIERVAGEGDDLEALKSIWYDPDDPNLPTGLAEHDIMYLAHNSVGDLLGACVLIAVEHHYFLNNLAGSDLGKKMGVQDLLLWHCVEDLADTDYDYVDVGVSYRSSLYRFFRKYKTIDYPVIFNRAPNSRPIAMAPSATLATTAARGPAQVQAGRNALAELTGTTSFTFVPDPSWARYVISELALPAPVVDLTWNLPNDGATSGWVDLAALFGLPFGALIVGAEVDDGELWNRFGCHDEFKRELVFSALINAAEDYDVIRVARTANLEHLTDLFSLDRISVQPSESKVPAHARLTTATFDLDYHTKLEEFGVDHQFHPDRGLVLPVHNGLGSEDMDTIYGIFRGVLNLCSEWTKTDVKARFVTGED